MIDKNTYIVIMAGGVGSRFWPLSRKSFPKQFHDFLGTGKSLIQMTYDRHLSICPKENFIVVTNEKYADLVKQHLPDLNENQILLEPFMRNTAPCIAYASYKIQKANPNAKFVVCPSDHLITNEDKYLQNLTTALNAAEKEDALYTIGIKPTRPDTGYGYIRYNAEDKKASKKVKTFTEKPNLELAQEFLESGDYVWNAGIFVWSAKSIIKAFTQLLPDEAEIFSEGIFHYNTAGEQEYINDVYEKCKNISIDYGIMEKAENVYTVLSDFTWSDLGTWNSIYEQREKQEDENVVDGNVMLYDVKNSIVRSSDKKLVVVDGLDDFIVVDHDNVLMICPRSEEQKVKKFVSDVKSQKGEDYI